MRDSFIFYRSLYESMLRLKDKDQIKLIKAICNLALNDAEPDNLTGTAETIYIAMKPLFLNKQKQKIKPVSKLECITLPNVEYTRLTQEQYDTLTNKYGQLVTDKAIEIFDAWLARGSKTAKGYINADSHYQHFRKDSWAINEAMKKLDTQPNWSV